MGFGLSPNSFSLFTELFLLVVVMTDVFWLVEVNMLYQDIVVVHTTENFSSVGRDRLIQTFFGGASGFLSLRNRRCI